MLVVQRVAALEPPSARLRHLPLAAATARATLFALLLYALLALPRAHSIDTAAGTGETASHECPQHQRGASILDLPDTADCRRLLRLLAPCLPHWHAATVTVEAGSACCGHAASFFQLGCHCWTSQFDGGVVAAVGGVDDACSPGGADTAAQQQAAAQRRQSQIQLEQGEQQQGGGGVGGALDRVRHAVFGGGGSQQQPILLQTGQAGAGGSEELGGVRLYIGVLSAAAKREARDAIRATWGSHPGSHLTRFFLARPANDTLFEQVRAEAVAKRDIVVLGHVTEHYLNITHQTLEVMRMAAASPAATHVLKTDDDSFVHVDRLLRRLASLPRELLFWGSIENPGGQPHRDAGNQWYVSREEWPEDRYPPWAHGAGYVLSADLAAELASGTAYAASQGGHLFKLEDIAVGSWLEWAAQRRGLRLHLVSDRRFNYGGCRAGDLVSHYIRPAQQLCMWAQDGRCRGC